MSLLTVSVRVGQEDNAVRADLSGNLGVAPDYNTFWV